MKRPLITTLVVTVVTFLMYLLVMPALQANAIEYGSIGGRPAHTEGGEGTGWFIYNLDYGEQLEDAILVINTDKEAADVLVYAADSVKSSSGGFALRQMTEPKEAVGSWIKFYPDPIPEQFASTFADVGESILDFCALELTGSEEWCEGVELVEIAMDAEDRKTIPFTFSMPMEMDAGEHTGGILIQKAKKEEQVDHQGTGITLTTRVGVRIYQTVPGEIDRTLYLEDFSVTKKFDEFDYSRIFTLNRAENRPESYLITTKIGNSGNVSTYFNQTIHISDDLFGNRDQEITDRRFQVLRNDVFHSNYSWQNPRFGKFTFGTTVTYLDSENQEHTLEAEEITIWIIPWREIVLAAAIIIFVLLVNKIRVIFYNKKYGGKGWIDYTISERDTLDQLCAKFNVDWQTLIKTNKLKPPYVIKQGQKILVPPSDWKTKKTPVKKEKGTKK